MLNDVLFVEKQFFKKIESILSWSFEPGYHLFLLFLVVAAFLLLIMVEFLSLAEAVLCLLVVSILVAALVLNLLHLLLLLETISFSSRLGKEAFLFG